MKKTLLTITTLALGAGILFAGTSSALAYRGNPKVQGPNYSPERHEEMTKAFENKDYNAWKNLMQGKGRVTQVVNENNFSEFSQMHKFMLEGKSEEANKIREELGLGTGMGMGRNRNR